MRHLRIILPLVALAAALSLPAAGSGAPIDQVRGPACGDITFYDDVQGGPPAYTTFGGTATLFSSLTTAKPSCANVTYTIYVYDETGTTLLTTPQTFTGDGTTSLFNYTFSPAGAPQKICVAATSSRGDKIIDAAPNDGCYVLTLGTSPGGSGLN